MFDNLSHERLNFFWLKENHELINLFNKVEQDIDLIGETLSMDNIAIENKAL